MDDLISVDWDLLWSVYQTQCLNLDPLRIYERKWKMG